MVVEGLPTPPGRARVPKDVLPRGRLEDEWDPARRSASEAPEEALEESRLAVALHGGDPTTEISGFHGREGGHDLDRLAEGGGIEPLRYAYPGVRDRLPAFQRHPL